MATQKQINAWLLSLPREERQNVAQSSGQGHVYAQLVAGSQVVAKAPLPKGKSPKAQGR